METNMNLEKFNPTKGELLALADQGRKLVINGIDDKEGYAAVHTHRMELKKARVTIAKTGKEAREEALAYQKKVIAYEKELIGIIEPIETELQEKQEAIDKEKARIERQVLLPSRIEKLKEIDIEMEPEALMDLDVEQFAEFYNKCRAEWIDKKEAALRAEQEKMEAEKAKLAEDQRLEEARKIAEKEAQEKALRDTEIAKAKAAEEAELAKIKAEEDKQAAVMAERQRAEREKEEFIAKKEQENQERIAAEEKAKADEAARIEKEKEEARKAKVRRPICPECNSHTIVGFAKPNEPFANNPLDYDQSTAELYCANGDTNCDYRVKFSDLTTPIN